jgi:hypothetical protein
VCTQVPFVNTSHTFPLHRDPPRPRLPCTQSRDRSESMSSEGGPYVRPTGWLGPRVGIDVGGTLVKVCYLETFPWKVRRHLDSPLNVSASLVEHHLIVSFRPCWHRLRGHVRVSSRLLGWHGNQVRWPLLGESSPDIASLQLTALLSVGRRWIQSEGPMG